MVSLLVVFSIVSFVLNIVLVRAYGSAVDDYSRVVSTWNPPSGSGGG